MRYSEFVQRVQEAMDARRRPESDPELAALAEREPRRRELLAGQEALLLGLRESEVRDPGPGFAAAVLDEALAQARTASVVPQPAVAAETRPAAAWIGVAAALLVACGIGVTLLTSAAPTALSEVSRRPSLAPAEGLRIVVDGDRPRTQVEQRTEDPMRELIQFVTVEQVQPSDLVRRFRGGVAPLARPMSEAFSVLLESLRKGSTPEKPQAGRGLPDQRRFI